MLNIEMWDGGLSQLRAVSGWSSGFLDRHLEAFFRVMKVSPRDSDRPTPDVPKYLTVCKR